VLADLKLRNKYAGFIYLAESARNLPSLQSHHHRELELNLVVQGTITYIVNGNRLTFSPRTLLWLFPGLEHQLIARSENARFYVVVFKPSLVNKSCHISKYEGLKRSPSDQSKLASTVLDPKSFDLISKMMESLMEGSLDSDLLNRENGFGPASDFRFEHHDPDALNAGLHHLLLLCWRYQIEGKTSGESVALHFAVRRAIKILSENDTAQNLDELSRTCGASKAYLSRIFHRQVGVPLTQYRNSLRLNRFFEAYRVTDSSTLAEAVYAAGFGSYAQFYKVFTKAYGRGPRECFRAMR
jgi:AraC-like DNA-binding protein